MAIRSAAVRPAGGAESGFVGGLRRESGRRYQPPTWLGGMAAGGGVSDIRARTYSSSTQGSGPLCIICFERERDANLSCGHRNLCSVCLAKLAKENESPQCPTCRAYLELTNAHRRPGLKPVRFRATGPRAGLPPCPPGVGLPPRPPSRRAPAVPAHPTAAATASPVPLSRRHSMGAPPTAVPGGALVLGLRGVDVKSLAERLRAVGSVRLPRQRERGRRALSELGSLGAREGPRYVWVTAADGVDDAAVARRARALSPAVVVLAFDASSQASFEAILRWDRALTSDLPVMWAALVAPDRRRAVSTTDIRNTLYCRGALHRPVVEVDTAAKLFRADVEAKRIAEAVVRYTSRSSIDSSPRGSLDSSRASAQYNRTRPEHGGFGWNLIRQCL